MQSRLDREATAMRAAFACGVPAPRVEGSITVDGRPGLLIERVDGPDLITLFGRRPWLVPRLIRRVGSLHAQMHGAVAPTELDDLRERIRRRIDDVPDAILPSKLADFARRRLDGLPDGDRLLHGDFHPGNVLLGSDGPRIIDWTATARGAPAADVARTCLMLSVGEPDPSMPTLVRRVEMFGRRTITKWYLRAYRRAAPMDDDSVRAWLPVRAAERFAEGIVGEYPRLMALLDAASEKAD
jgi:aminoglycoside phosphotransferase (APT) family kinase protein